MMYIPIGRRQYSWWGMLGHFYILDLPEMVVKTLIADEKGNRSQ